jgi:hypothetical protein
MNKCKFCGKDSLVWKEIVILNNNHVWRPFKDGKLHDCRGVWYRSGELRAKCKFCGEGGLVWKSKEFNEMLFHELKITNKWRQFIYRGLGLEAVTLHKCRTGSERGEMYSTANWDADTGYEDHVLKESITVCMSDICENCSGEGCSECGGIDPDPGTNVTNPP